MTIENWIQPHIQKKKKWVKNTAKPARSRFSAMRNLGLVKPGGCYASEEMEDSCLKYSRGSSSGEYSHLAACGERWITRAPLKKYNSTSKLVGRWTGLPYSPTSLVSPRDLLMSNFLKLKPFRKLSNWMNLNYMVVSWKCRLSEQMSQGWNSSVHGASIRTWDHDSGVRLCHTIPLSDMGNFPDSEGQCRATCLTIEYSWWPILGHIAENKLMRFLPSAAN